MVNQLGSGIQGSSCAESMLLSARARHLTKVVGKTADIWGCGYPSLSVQEQTLKFQAICTLSYQTKQWQRTICHILLSPTESLEIRFLVLKQLLALTSTC